MFPALDVPGYSRRTVIASGVVSYVDQESPGYIAQRVLSNTSYVYSRLRKRYGNNGKQTSLPFGLNPPPLLAMGENPPPVTLTGRPTLGSLQVVLTVVSGGEFSYSLDGGITSQTAPIGGTVVLGNSGLSANFGAGTYTVGMVFAAATPIPEAVLNWIIKLTDYDVYRRRGIDPNDPLMLMVTNDRNDALKELSEAANSKDGLFDLPVNDDSDSAVTTGGPLAYTDPSPYEAVYRADRQGREEDGYDAD